MMWWWCRNHLKFLLLMLQNLCLRVKSPQLDVEIPTVHGLILFNPWLHREPIACHRPRCGPWNAAWRPAVPRCRWAAWLRPTSRTCRRRCSRSRRGWGDGRHGTKHRGATPELWCGFMGQNGENGQNPWNDYLWGNEHQGMTGLWDDGMIGIEKTTTIIRFSNFESCFRRWEFVQQGIKA